MPKAATARPATPTPPEAESPSPNVPPILSLPMLKTVDTGVFAKELKRKSLYPTFRTIVSLNFIFCCLVGMVLIGASLVALDRCLGSGLLLLCGGFFVIILGKVLQELSLMLADAADAAVYIAAHTKKE